MSSAFACSVWVEGVDAGAFVHAAAHLARTRGADLLLSGPPGRTGRPAEVRSVVGVDPAAELTADRDTPTDAIRSFCLEGPGPAMGYLSYEFGMRLMDVPWRKQTELPLAHFRRYRAVVEHFHDTDRCRVRAAAPELVSELAALLKNPPRAEIAPVRLPDGPVRASLSRSQYESRVARVLALIRSGDCYQLNLSIRFERDAPDLDPLALLLTLFRERPAAFYAWFPSGDRAILSTSPELFLRVRSGAVRSEPIKGTRRLATGGNTEEDRAALESLRQSPKEDAELSMIVDLVRNDLSACCVPGTVAVPEHKSVFRVDDLLQMHSVVTGELAPGCDCLDLLFAAVPGGSVTGCPKRRAMQRIEELEPHARSVYCGSFVLVEDERTLDASICIRTAVHERESGVLATWAGSGIVVDSDPGAEYEETMAKADKFLRNGGAS